MVSAATAAAPASATVIYNLFRNGVRLGVITEQFEAKDGAYRATSEAHATGFFALVQREPIRYISNGTVTRDGLRPQPRGGAAARRARPPVDHVSTDVRGESR